MARAHSRFWIPLSVPLLLPVFACVEPDTSATTDATGGDESDATGSDSAGDTDGDGDGDPEPLLATWHQDIAPIVTEKCGGCHRDGGIAPFSIQTYEQAAPWATLSLEAILANDMPPWGQDNTDECQPRHGFKDDPRLSAEELALFEGWIAHGTPEGDPDSAAQLPEPPVLELDDADLRITTDEITLEPGKDQFWCFVLDPGFDSPQLIDATQIVAGNEKIVHHVLIYLDESGQAEQLAGDEGKYECFGGPGLGQPTLIAAWAPGVPPQRLPEEVAMNIPAGAKLVVNVHYHPTGETEVDPGTSLDLRFAQGNKQYLGQLLLMGNFSSGSGLSGLQPGPNDSGDTPEFRIPAGAVGHTEEMLFRLPNSIPDLHLFQAGTHMHYVGTDMLLGLDRAEPEAGTGIDKECLIQTPHYDFEWQRGYDYDAKFEDLPTAKAGDYLYMKCTYDNSMGNPHVVEALAEQGLTEPVDVFLGEETLDEMCLGVYGIAYSILP
jgi:hypothetical protein